MPLSFPYCNLRNIATGYTVPRLTIAFSCEARPENDLDFAMHGRNIGLTQWPWSAWRGVLLAFLGGLLSLNASIACAQTADPATDKISKDLQSAISTPTTPLLSWARDVDGVRYLKVLIVSQSRDADLSSLRAAVLRNGGSVYHALRVGRGAVQRCCLPAALPSSLVGPMCRTSRRIGSLPSTAMPTTLLSASAAGQATNLGSVTEQAAGIGGVRTRSPGSASYFGA